MKEETKFDKHYSEDGFWNKLKKYANVAGQKIVYSGLILYFALDSPKISLKDKAMIYGGLGYLIFPVDAIPDPLLLVGYADDLGVLLFTAARVAISIDAIVKNKAKDKLVDFFGNNEIKQDEINEIDKQLDGEDTTDSS